jgi:YHS domain-containing protein
MDKPVQWALVGAAWFLALSVALFGYLAWQRTGSAAPAAAGSAAQWSVASDGTAQCPVTGKRIQVGPATPKVVYMGKTYYFADDKDDQGNDARSRFLMDPDSYLKPQGPGQ